MVLDEPNDQDDVFKVNGFTLVVDKNLHDMTKGITIDYIQQGMRSGFSLSTETPIGGAGSSCGSSCSC